MKRIEMEKKKIRFFFGKYREQNLSWEKDENEAIKAGFIHVSQTYKLNIYWIARIKHDISI